MRRFALGMTLLACAVVAPGWARADDQAIAQKIVQELGQQKEKGNLQGFSLQLQVNEGVVWLKGHVSNAEQEFLALDRARRVPGVVKVVNAIQVKPDPNSKERTPLLDPVETEDAELDVPEPVVSKPVVSQPSRTAETETPEPPQAFSARRTSHEKPADAEEKAPESAAKTANSMKPADAKDEAAEAIEKTALPIPATTDARRLLKVIPVKPVTSVPNLPAPPEQIRSTTAETKPTVTARPVAHRAQEFSDEQIAENIIQRLKRYKDNGELRGFGVDVSVVGGDVLLKGRVSNRDQLGLVLDTARHVPGVKQVVNDLTITAPATSKPAAPQPAVNLTANNEVSGNSVGVAVAATPAPNANPVQSSPAGATPQAIVQTRPAPNGSLAQAAPVNAVPVQAIPVQAVRLGQMVPAGQMAPAGYDSMPQMPAAGYHAMHASQMPGQVPGGHPPMPTSQMPRPYAPAQLVNHSMGPVHGSPVPMHAPTQGGYGVAPARFDHPQMPGYAWPSYAPHPNYASLTYPKQYSAQAWPYIGPFYPYPQVPLGWRKVELQWDDGWWFLDFKSK